MKKEEAIKILEQAINYKDDSSTQEGNWILGTDGVEAIKIAIEALKD
jgi:hypothetical protein